MKNGKKLKTRYVSSQKQSVAEAFKAMSKRQRKTKAFAMGDEYLHELLDEYDEYKEWQDQDDKSKRPALSTRIQALGHRCEKAEQATQQLVPQLRKDLHDAGRRIEDLELRERLNSYEVQAIHELLKAAGAPREGTILERMQAVLKRKPLT